MSVVSAAVVRALPALLAVFASAVPALSAPRHPARADGPALLRKYCSECHSGQLKFDAGDVENLRSTGVVVRGNAAKSPIWVRLNATKGQMPPKGSPQPTAAEKETIRKWIEPTEGESAPAAAPSAAGPRRMVKETEILAAVLADLQEAGERDLPFLRYFSLANLHRNPSVKDDDLKRYRLALDKLLNSLSWNPVVVRTKAIGPEGLVLRLDVRTLRWERDAWAKVVARYPYGYRPKDGAKTADQIRTLSGAGVPTIRVDWFVATASRPPLYHDLLQLPRTDRELEAKLGVDAERDMEQESDIHRAGMTNSNVSNNNRVVQRHTSNYGAYWKSFDFKDNEGRHDIFRHPMDYAADGGEYIFQLPNKLLAYMITDARGNRLDQAPVEVVFDKSTPQSGGIIMNGVSCIGCHASGLKPVEDTVRKALLRLAKSDVFDLDKAKAIYTGGEAVNAKVEEDNAQFREALAKVGAEPTSPSLEPIVTIARYYLSNSAAVTTRQAAADLGLSAAELMRLIGRSSELQDMGLTRLEDEDGAIKRDTWESAFPAVIRALGMGTPAMRADSADAEPGSAVVGGGTATVAPAPRTALGLELDRGGSARYRVGERVGIALEPGFDGYLYVYGIDAKGNAALLFPTGGAGAGRGRVSAGDRLRIGRAGDLVEIAVAEATGDEAVVALLSEVERPGLPGVGTSGASKGLVAVAAKPAALRRQLADLVAQAKVQGRRAVVSEARLRTED